MALNKTYTTENLNTAVGPSSPKPSPIAILAAGTEAFKACFGEFRGLVGEIMTKQLEMMDKLDAADRLPAFKLLIEMNMEMIKSDERVQIAVLGTAERLGLAAAAVLPSVLSLRQAGIELSTAQISADAKERAERAEECARMEEERKALDALRSASSKSYVNGKYVPTDAK